jgi:hypothetical protein
VPPLGLSIHLGCTVFNNIAKAALLPQGGKALFFHQLDNEVFKTLPCTIEISVGHYFVVLRDSAGVGPAKQSLTVSVALTMGGAETYTDDVKAKTYKIIFKVSDCIPPYKSDAGEMVNDRFTSKLIESEKPVNIVVTDNVGCGAEKEVAHTVEVCNLPCEGMARYCSYRLWMP